MAGNHQQQGGKAEVALSAARGTAPSHMGRGLRASSRARAALAMICASLACSAAAREYVYTVVSANADPAFFQRRRVGTVLAMRRSRVRR